MSAPTHSAGPFSRVAFFLDRSHSLRTFTFRARQVAPTGSQVNVLSTQYTGGPTFHEVFIDTEFLRSAS